MTARLCTLYKILHFVVCSVANYIRIKIKNITPKCVNSCKETCGANTCGLHKHLLLPFIRITLNSTIIPMIDHNKSLNGCIIYNSLKNCFKIQYADPR